MKRFIGLLSAVMLTGGLAVLAPSSPASADPFCAGVGSATVAAPGLQYPALGTQRPSGTPSV